MSLRVRSERLVGWHLTACWHCGAWRRLRASGHQPALKAASCQIKPLRRCSPKSTSSHSRHATSKRFKSVIEQNRQGYFIALRQTHATVRTDAPNWQPWITFFLSSLCSQVKRLEVKIEREQLMLATLPQLSMQILWIAKEQGRVTLTSAQLNTQANRNTVRLHIRKLIVSGQLEQHGIGRSTWYSPVIRPT